MLNHLHSIHHVNHKFEIKPRRIKLKCFSTLPLNTHPHHCFWHPHRPPLFLSLFLSLASRFLIVLCCCCSVSCLFKAIQVKIHGLESETQTNACKTHTQTQPSSHNKYNHSSRSVLVCALLASKNILDSTPYSMWAMCDLLSLYILSVYTHIKQDSELYTAQVVWLYFFFSQFSMCSKYVYASS